MSVLNEALLGLRRMIASGELKPGDRFPSEPQLCEELQVSRTSMREAVRILSALGVTEARHGSGIYVSSLDPAELFESLSLTIGLLPLEGVLDLFEVRRVLEAHATGQAASKATDEELMELEDIVRRLGEEKDNRAAATLDAEFHLKIAEIAGNSTMRSLIALLRVRNKAYADLFSLEGGKERRALSEHGHRQIMAGLKARDYLAASGAAEQHLALTEQWLRESQPTASDTDIHGEFIG